MRKLTIGDLVAKYPIIQGGMGVGVSLSGLAAAVANEGGVGVISAAGLGLYYMQEANNYIDACIYGLKQELIRAREKTKGIIGVNIMVAVSNFSDLVTTSIEEKADIIFSGAGLPLDLPSYLKEDSTTKLVPIVSSARATKIICEKWKSNFN
ncbi:MAG: nitronate monooxygenase, partial [Bacteroidales bacterium]